MDRTHNCAVCEFMRMYDYGNKIYYCDHENRTDDMGKFRGTFTSLYLER